MKLLSRIAAVSILLTSGCAPSYPLHNADFLGERTVNYRADHDEIRVGRQVGAFRAIKLGVKRNDVFIRSVRIYFEHGSSQTIRFQHPLREGRVTRSIDLKGGRRRIDRVVLNYETIDRRSRSDRRAIVALYGIRH